MKTQNFYIKINYFLIFLQLLTKIFCADSDCSNSNGLTCYQCDTRCREQSRKKCAPGDDICFDFRYKDGTTEKGCMKEADYKSTWEEKNKNHNGLGKDSYKCKGNLCNNQINDGLRCFQCYNSCTNPVEAKCLPEQDACFHFLWNDGSIWKGCVEEKKYQHLQYSERNNNKHGLDSFSYKCKEYLCNEKKFENDPNIQSRQVCVKCNGKCDKMENSFCTEKQDSCYSFFFKDGTIDKGCVIGENYDNVYNQNKYRHKGLREYSFKCNNKRCNV